MYETMKRHLEICTAVNRCRKHDADITKRHSAETLQEFFSEVKELGLEPEIGQLSSEETDKLIANCGFCQEIQWLLEVGIQFDRIRGFLHYYPGKDLCACDYATLKEALEDEDIPTEYVYDFWAYYLFCHLDKGQKTSLLNGIWYLRRKSDYMVGDIQEKHRRLLWEPCFCEDMFDGKIKIPELLIKMENAEFVSLLNQLYEWTEGYVGIEDKELAQMVKDASEIQICLEQVMDKIPQECWDSFVANWLGNGNLIYDLKRLIRMDADQLKNVAANRVAYIGSIYGASLAGIGLERLDNQREDLLIYAVTHKKRHFLALVRDHSDLFCNIPGDSVLFEPEFYAHVNINTLNEQDLIECTNHNKNDLPKDNVLLREYTFNEMKCLLGQKRAYHLLYGYLDYPRVDDRLRVFREVTKKQCVPRDCNEDDLKILGRCLSQKSLSRWMNEDFANIDGLNSVDCVRILINEELLGPYLHDLKHSFQIQYLLRNMDKLGDFQNLKEFEEHMIDTDVAWKELRHEFGLTDEFIAKNKEHISAFLYQDGAGIVSAFCDDNDSCKESARRLLIAELMGRFRELKYHKDDLSKEIDFPVSSEQKTQWMQNESVQDSDGFRIWEEDELLPVMQIGEVPTYTCMSYRTGGQKDCLLSCFDTNKKIIFASRGSEVVFRAIIRLTKARDGAYTNYLHEDAKPEVEFVDLSTEEGSGKDARTAGEHLILFLERAYYSSISPDDWYHLVKSVAEFAYRKAKKLRANLVISNDYHVLCNEENVYFTSKHSIYISKSKNGRQYLDSMGGAASITDSGSYRSGIFITKDR